MYDDDTDDDTDYGTDYGPMPTCPVCNPDPNYPERRSETLYCGHYYDPLTPYWTED